MRYEVISGREIDDGLAAVWRDLLVRNKDLNSPYFSSDFARAVSAVRSDVYVTLMEDSGDVVGLFPFQSSGRRVGRPVGGAFSDYQAVIIHPEAEWSAADLVRGSQLRVWEFDHLLACQKPFAPYCRGRSRSLLIIMEDGFNAFSLALRNRGSCELNDAARRRRRLEREVGPLRFEASTRDARVLEKVMEWKGLQFLRAGPVNPFDFHWTRDLLYRILATDTEEFGAFMSALYAGDKLVAAHMGMRSRDVLHYWFPAFNREFSPYSPGIVLLLCMAEAADAQGIRVFDLGKGEEEYKLRLFNGVVRLVEGFVELPCIATTLRKTKRGAESVIRRSGLAAAVRAPGRVLRRIESRNRFR